MIRRIWRDYGTRPLLTILFLGFSSGLPLLLVWSTLSAWFYEAKVDLGLIGLLATIRTPYALKFVWAPIIDSLQLPILCRLFGRRRGWMLATQILLALSLVFLSFSAPASAPAIAALAAFLVAFFSASQDIVIDAYRIESLNAEEQGRGAAIAQLGYRLGMLVAGAGSFYLASYMSWQTTYLIMAGVMGIGIVTTLIAKEPQASARIAAEPHTRYAFIPWVKRAVIEPFADFTRHESWWIILLFIIAYKLADAFMGGMTNPFFLAIGFDKITIANVVKICGLIPTLLGIFLGGMLTDRYGALRVLFIAGVMHALTNLLFVLQAHVGADTTLLSLSIVAENLTAGISSAAFVAYLSGLCNVHYTGTQYALLSSLAAFGTTWFAAPAGYVVKWLGWGPFFTFAALLAVPGLVILLALNKRLDDKTAPAR